MRALLTVVAYVGGGVIPVEEMELAAVDVVMVPHDAVLCGERLLMFVASACRANKRDAVPSASLKSARTSRAGFA